MTGYYLELGYNSSLGTPQLGLAFSTLVGVFMNLVNDPDRVTREVLRLEPGADAVLVLQVAGWYGHPDRPKEDLTFKVVERGDTHPEINALEAAEFKPYIQQYASGGGAQRGASESVRRAFCRLVIEDMHRLKIEVNLRVS